jgi:hypothetical protein
VNAVALAGLLAVQGAEAPVLAPGDRVRVHVLVQSTFLGMPAPGLRRVTYDGTLTYYAAADRLALTRDTSKFRPPIPAAVEINWIEVHRIDVPRGSNWLSGAAKGAGAAFIGAGVHALFCSAFGGEAADADGCPFWKYVGLYAAVTVPVGALIGSRSTRWKPVYERKR